jgi:hypothetical protein
MTWASGSKYVGLWKNSLPNGLDTYTDTDGVTHISEFKDGSKLGPDFTYPNGRKYDDRLKDKKQHGRGTHIW